jgi:hypothetical protein
MKISSGVSQSHRGNESFEIVQYMGVFISFHWVFGEGGGKKRKGKGRDCGKSSTSLLLC